MKVVVYYRVSSQKQADSGLGLDAQRTAVESFCRAKGYQVASEHTDEAVSGRTGLIDRPALSDAVASMRENEAKAIVVAKLDRLGRDVLELLTIEKELKRIGARIVSAAGEGTAEDNAQNKFLRSILASVGEYEANLISARTKAAMKAAKDKGTHTGRPPFGMSKIGGRIVPNDDFWAVVVICRMHLRDGLSYREIAKAFEGDTDLSATIHPTTVARIIKRWKDHKVEGDEGMSVFWENPETDGLNTWDHPWYQPVL